MSTVCDVMEEEEEERREVDTDMSLKVEMNVQSLFQLVSLIDVIYIMGFQCFCT